MEKEDIYKTVAKIINETFEIPLNDIAMESTLQEDLDLDSIDAVDLIVKLQKYTTKNIDPEEFKKVRTISDVVDAISSIANDSEFSAI